MGGEGIARSGASAYPRMEGGRGGRGISALRRCAYGGHRRISVSRLRPSDLCPDSAAGQCDPGPGSRIHSAKCPKPSVQSSPCTYILGHIA